MQTDTAIQMKDIYFVSTAVHATCNRVEALDQDFDAELRAQLRKQPLKDREAIAEAICSMARSIGTPDYEAFEARIFEVALSA
jgi:hypothetical protein